METTGMTESDEHAALGMAGASLEDAAIKDETESMDDERDPEVGKCTTHVCFSRNDCELEIGNKLSLTVLFCFSNSLVQ